MQKVDNKTVAIVVSICIVGAGTLVLANLWIPYSCEDYLNDGAASLETEYAKREHKIRLADVLEYYGERYTMIGDGLDLSIPIQLWISDERLEFYIRLSEDDLWYEENIIDKNRRRKKGNFISISGKR